MRDDSMLDYCRTGLGDDAADNTVLSGPMANIAVDKITDSMLKARASTVSTLSEENFTLRLEVQNLDDALYTLQSKFDFLDKKCKESNTGVTIERWNAFGRTGNKEGVRYRLMWNGHIGNAADSLMHCIENEMKV